MVNNNGLWEWATGQKSEVLEEKDKVDSMRVEIEEAVPVKSPSEQPEGERYEDEDFEPPAGQEYSSLVPL